MRPLPARLMGKLMSLSALLCALLALSLVPGTASIYGATSGPGIPRMNTAPLAPKRQLRAAWLATVQNIDWPSKPGLPVDTQKQEYTAHLDEMQQMNLNAIVVQVRPTADAFYPSRYAPWSAYLTGTQGQDPGYDPLAFMVNETHKRGMEFHAWFNPYRVSMQGDINQLVANHPARLNPDWVVSYGGKLYYNPGVPAARQYVEDSILEVVRNYDIDAIHLDDYFYPYKVGNQDFPDDAAYQRYGSGSFAKKDDWRRANINLLVYELSTRIKQIKSFVKFGISPFGVWRNKVADPTGSDTAATQTSYDDLYADARAWIRNNWLDYIAPQIYWSIGFTPAAYDKLVAWWANEVSRSRVQLYIGQGVYKIGTSETTDWQSPDEMPNQLALNLQYPQIQGSIFFSLSSLHANPLGFKDRLSSTIYHTPALVPTMSWLPRTNPRSLTLQPLEQSAQGITLHWSDAPYNGTIAYVIYRFSSNGTTQATDFNTGTNILTILPKLQNNYQHAFMDTSIQAGGNYTYYITPVDRLHNEGTPVRWQPVTQR
ncbi:hypothetical protein KSC_036370 [Ktedonobacter sp. SOSP1-52]|uniref:glycoside hydrolase family 10 protein n=1 Tax=Ktedonobacter sp. SOSP1-52 TaxID=2778366 RepID=UPI0019161E42|nr:family 10 glycosylhydrolase [Ktedonobacter sp. SOSP1-52]GHO64745.1 hypothetical protein KSC_036370 [Ktedonobacter sp. SOSP1-52]